MKLAFSHLQHKCRQGFKDTLNPLCSWSIRAEKITHYFLRWYFYISNLANLINDFKILPLSLLKLVITTLLLFFYMAMISSMTQIIRKCWCQLSDSLTVRRDLMWSCSDDLLVCYTYPVNFTCGFSEGFTLKFQRASFTRYFTLDLFFACNFNFYFSQ